MSSLYELHNILRNLHSSKLTERRNAFRDLKSSLQSPSVQSALDQSSEKKGNLTWDGVAVNVLKVVSTSAAG